MTAAAFILVGLVIALASFSAGLYVGEVIRDRQERRS